MGNSFNKILYTVLAVIFIALLLVKFFFKRSIPISELSMNKRKLEKLSAGNAIPINIKERQFSNSKNIILKKRMTIKRAKKEVDFTTKGSKYSFTGEIKGKSLIVENQNTGNRSEFTGSLMVKLKSKGQLERVLKEYNLKLIKDFSNIGYYYLSGNSAIDVKKQLVTIYNDKRFNIVEPEILGRKIKIR